MFAVVAQRCAGIRTREGAVSYHALGDVSTGTLVTGAISAGGALIGGIVKGADARTGGGTGPAEDPAFSTVPSFITPDATAPSSALPGWAIPVAAVAGIGIVALMTVALLKKKPVTKNARRRVQRAIFGGAAADAAVPMPESHYGGKIGEYYVRSAQGKPRGPTSLAAVRRLISGPGRARKRVRPNDRVPSLSEWKRLDDAAWSWDCGDGTRYVVMRQVRRSLRRKRPTRDGYVLLVLRPSRTGMSASARDIRYVDASDGHEGRDVDAVAWFASPEAAAAAVPCAS